MNGLYHVNSYVVIHKSPTAPSSPNRNWKMASYRKLKREPDSVEFCTPTLLKLLVLNTSTRFLNLYLLANNTAPGTIVAKLF